MREIRLFLILSVVLAAGCKPLTASTSLPVNPTTSPGLTSPPPAFQTPPPGQDSGHHGVDFAYYHMGAHTQMLGLPVYSALTGTVAAAILNRPPYGNMVIIETSLDALPANLIQQMAATPVPTPTHPDNRLSCPIHTPHPEWSPSQQSLYLLYAHLNQTPLVKIGQPIPCGGQIGEVGNTGSSGNPHLHFETRLGPSGITFNHMSHYNTQATTEEMDNYCTWRISGVFQLFDPLALLALGKSSK
jgi:murein DD-endopeptidase MepM/ murein hydrolase activator NlpD